MKVLLTNDDGIDAPGLGALARAVNGSFEKIIAAPHTERSGCSHSTTTDRPIQFQQRDVNRYSVEGTPADCVRVVLHQFPGEVAYVLAGINSGGNLGVDVYHSGTVAAVREAALYGIPGIAISHYRDRQLTTEDWLRAAKWCAPIIRDILSRRSEPNVIWNVNLPCLPTEEEAVEVVECPLDLSPLPLHFLAEEAGLRYAGEYSERARTAGSDIDVCFSGKIAVTRIPLVG
jgi:5'/3'-nucleotidase